MKVGVEARLRPPPWHFVAPANQCPEQIERDDGHAPLSPLLQQADFLATYLSRLPLSFTRMMLVWRKWWFQPGSREPISK